MHPIAVAAIVCPQGAPVAVGMAAFAALHERPSREYEKRSGANAAHDWQPYKRL
jgi:hypothetical protein